jgi:H+-transporting ATPase
MQKEKPQGAKGRKAYRPAAAAPKETLEEVKRRLGAPADGLSAEEVRKRQEQYGYNEIEEKKVNPLLKFLSYFWGPIPWMIEVAAVLSAVVRDWEDFGIILALLVVNGIVGFWEEYQAGNTVAALKAQLAVRAVAKRGGKWAEVAVRDLVPGDRIRLEIGDIVPADARLLEGDPVEVDQSALTGESLPANVETGGVLYSGSILKQGEGEALVNATGASTYFGKTVQMVEEAHTESHFQRAVLKIGDYLIVVALALVLIILVTALFRGDPFVRTLQFALILTVAAIPVAMPTVLSVTMAIGARVLAKLKAVVTRLASIEEMAGMDVLCSDKTGTLTQNKLSLGEPHAVRGVEPAEAGELERYRVSHFVPFDPVHKRTEATVQGPSGSFKVTKGAAQVIMDLTAEEAGVKEEAEKAVEQLAARGFRSLGVARSSEGGPWRLLGILPLYDPPREDSRDTIRAAEEMGVRVKMVTGDQLPIAREMASQLGMGRNILDAAVFADTEHHKLEQLGDEIEKADGFAQVFPEHKYHIVDALEKRGHFVGMTGDGVNDAPALKKAHAGIAVSGASDAARSAADIVLLAPGLSVIVEAIKESRKIFQRMNSYVIYRIAETIRILLFMALSILAFNFYPVTALMIVLLALLNDGAILSIASDRVRYSRSPEAFDMPVILGVATLLGIMGVVESFGLFYLAERIFGLSRDMIQTLIYLKLSVAGHLTIFVTRTRDRFWSHPPSRLLLLAVVATQAVATLISAFGLFMSPIGWKWAGFVWAYALIWFLVEDQVKLGAYRIFDRQQSVLPRKRRRSR